MKVKFSAVGEVYITSFKKLKWLDRDSLLSDQMQYETIAGNFSVYKNGSLIFKLLTYRVNLGHYLFSEAIR